MNTSPKSSAEPTFSHDSPAAIRRRKWRMFVDRAVRHGVGLGGISVIVAITLILFYLVFVVVPLFKPASIDPVAQYDVPGGNASHTAYYALDEYGELGIRYLADGHVVFFSLLDGKVVSTEAVQVPAGATVVSFAKGDPATGIVAYGFSNGTALLVKHAYALSYDGAKRVVTPQLSYPMGTEPLVVDAKGGSLAQLAVENLETGATLAAAMADGRIVIAHFGREESLLADDGALVRLGSVVRESGAAVTRLLLTKNQDILYAVDADGGITQFDVRDKENVLETVRVVPVEGSKKPLTVDFLAGSTSLIVGTPGGTLSQWFPVRDDKNRNVLRHIRDLGELPEGPQFGIAPEFYRKSVAVVASDHIDLYHATANRLVAQLKIDGATLTQAAFNARASHLVAEDSAAKLHVMSVENPHPEVSWSALWSKVWYESYGAPAYIWQSSSASDDFEAKFSLVPLSFGTLKAAFYAMLIAAPLSILGAIYTAYFMSPKLRQVVKPTIEIMEALPTVILGFLAGLWLAPFMEEHLPGVFSLLMLLPIGGLLFAYVWSLMPARVRHAVPEGWQPVLLIPVVLLLGWVSLGLSPHMEALFFDGNMALWMREEFGVSFDQRNALVVGIAMGVAVVPPIFSIAEDAIFSVPKHLTIGSLALGATPWQTFTRVVILTASPGIFSAVMIGFGRAVGETMIVLMATGNTPVMDLNIFQGMRTLSANIAVEMPESALNSTHYRVLFLAALVLFLFTFVFNTLAEVVRQRLRRKYSSL